jgi:NAD(P)-dependent dehydrogenase (short-subunit alcohol dehydrogenase family)
VTDIALIARTASQLENTARLVEEGGAHAHVFIVDLIDVAQLEGAAAEVSRSVGRVDVLINNAGMVAPLGPTVTQSAAAMLDAFRLNTLAPTLLAGAMLPSMVDTGWGRIVNVSSGIVAHPAGMIGGSTYAATKAALEAQTLSMAAEYANTGVRINIYRPGGVDTAMQEWIRTQDPNEIGHALHERFVDSHATGTLLTPDASAAALVAHLSREETGQVWDVTDSN